MGFRRHKLTKLACEVCGSGEFTKDDDGLFVCDFCRTKYTPAQAKKLVEVVVNRSNETANLLILANSALESDKPKKAYEYACKALEIDASDSEAWIVKGKSTGLMSKPGECRIGETIADFKTAQKITPTNEFKVSSGAALSEVAYGIHTNSWIAIIGDMNWGPKWSQHLATSYELIDALWVAYGWCKNQDPLDNILKIGDQLVSGVQLRGSFSEVGVATVNRINEKIDEAEREISVINPQYSPQRKLQPTITPGKCFVITATMGNEFSPPVVILREFRDQVLRPTSFGKAFISWYYKVGPKIANVIRSSILLRFLSLVFIVAPSTFAAWSLLKIRQTRHD